MKNKKETTIRVHQEFGIPAAVHDSIDALCKEARREGCFVVVETNGAGEISLRKIGVGEVIAVRVL